MYTLIARSVDHDVSPDHHGYTGLGEDDLHAVEISSRRVLRSLLGYWREWLGPLQILQELKVSWPEVHRLNPLVTIGKIVLIISRSGVNSVECCI